MALTKSFVQGLLEGEIKNKNKYDELCARDYLSSMFYNKDIEINKENFFAIEKRVESLKSAISAITSKINTKWESSFHNTHDSLVNLNNKISSEITSDVKTEIENKSIEAFEKYLQEYNKNYENYDKTVTYINNLLSSYDELSRKLDHINNQINGVVLGEELNNLRSRKRTTERQMESVLNSCTANIDVIRNANLANKDLLEKGLKKAV